MSEHLLEMAKAIVRIKDGKIDVLSDPSVSFCPLRHDLYGMPEAPRFPFRFRPDGILEIPVTTVAFGSRNYPCGGGGYFRLLPYRVSCWSLRRIHAVDGKPAMFYFHPWELDPEQPRVAGAGAKARFRHYVNLGHMESRLRRLLGDFRWDRADRIFLEGGE